MYFPVAGKTLFGFALAEEAARDLAADCRDLIREGLKIAEAVAAGDVSGSDLEKKKMIDEQIKGYCDTIFVTEDGTEYPVRDYVTPKREAQAFERKKLIKKAYENVKRWLH